MVDTFPDPYSYFVETCAQQDPMGALGPSLPWKANRVPAGPPLHPVGSPYALDASDIACPVAADNLVVSIKDRLRLTSEFWVFACPSGHARELWLNSCPSGIKPSSHDEQSQGSRPNEMDDRHRCSCISMLRVNTSWCKVLTANGP